MANPGPKPTSPEVLKLRGSWRAQKPRPKDARPTMVKPARARQVRGLEDICRTGIPGYDPWRDAGDCVFDRKAAKAAILFFETQLAGDGPGPAALKTDDDVAQLLHSLGASTVNAIATYPVTGRPASRTVWEVRK